MKNVTAAVSVKAPVMQASFEETHHRECDGVSKTIKDNWRTRANAKPVTVVRSVRHAV